MFSSDDHAVDARETLLSGGTLGSGAAQHLEFALESRRCQRHIGALRILWCLSQEQEIDSRVHDLLVGILRRNGRG